jgi:hypothetical protein
VLLCFTFHSMNQKYQQHLKDLVHCLHHQRVHIDYQLMLLQDKNVSSVVWPVWRQSLRHRAGPPEAAHPRMGEAARRRSYEGGRRRDDGATERRSDEKASRRGAEPRPKPKPSPREMSSSRAVEPTSQRDDETTRRRAKTDEL